MKTKGIGTEGERRIQVEILLMDFRHKAYHGLAGFPLAKLARV